jgi:hypothetical protein
MSVRYQHTISNIIDSEVCHKSILRLVTIRVEGMNLETSILVSVTLFLTFDIEDW